MSFVRKHPRFINRKRVLLQLEGREELRPHWMENISKGGLFVVSPDPPELRDTVEVTIETPNGRLLLKAEVVHRISNEDAAQLGMPAGVGLQFIDLTPEKKGAIEKYVDGIAARLDAGGEEDVASATSEVVAQTLQCFLKGFEADDLYQAIDLEPLSTQEEVNQRLDALREMFVKPPISMTPAQKTRLHHAGQLLHKVTRLLRDPARRLDYDFRHGHIFAEERIGADEDLQLLRSIWHRSFPGKLDEAEKHAACAMRFENILDFEKAIAAGSTAMRFDPFNLDLRRAVSEWELQLKAREVRERNARAQLTAREQALPLDENSH